MVPPNSDRVSRAPPYSGYRYPLHLLPIRGCHPLALLSRSFRFLMHEMSRSYNPSTAVTALVWANPRSLATTYGITFVFFSSAYLDVSVQRVCPSIDVTCLQHAGLPHSEIFGYSACVPLPEAYRSLSRPSSPMRAKAFTMCS